MTQDDKRDTPWDPSGGAWVNATMPTIMARRAEHERHFAACTDRPCERCERFVCRCGALIEGARECSACARESHVTSLMRPTLDSVPEDFRWALGATVQQLRANSSRTGRPCVALSDAGVSRAITAPPAAHLHFRGETGSGKTTLAIAMLYAFVRTNPEKRRGSFFVESTDLARARKEYRLGDGEAPLIARACRVPLLLVDELAGETDDRDGGIKDVIYRRAAASKPTWVTCGQVATLDDVQFARYLTERYDGGCARRICEIGKPIRLGHVPASETGSEGR